MMKRALEGISVLDFTWAGAGPYVTKCLADHGARVIRVESERRPDAARASPPYKDGKPGVNRSLFWIGNNTNKYSIALNLNHPNALDIVSRLVARADIVAENFAPGRMEKWKLGYQELKKVKPDIIMLRLSAQGQTGPHSKHPGYGNMLVGLAGFTQITGWPDREPVQPYGAYTDLTAPPCGVTAVIAALIHRRHTGRGLCLDLSEYEAGIHFLEPAILDYIVNGREATRIGNQHPFAGACPHSVYRCQGEDRWCAISVYRDEEWLAFCRVVDNPKLKDQKFATTLDRKQNESELNALVENWTANLPAEDVMALMQSAGVAAGVVNTSRDLSEDIQLRARNYFWTMSHAEMGACRHFGQPFVLSRTPAEPRMPAPCLGEHTELVCREFLGMPGAEFVELFNTGVFE